MAKPKKPEVADDQIRLHPGDKNILLLEDDSGFEVMLTLRAGIMGGTMSVHQYDGKVPITIRRKHTDKAKFRKVLLPALKPCKVTTNYRRGYTLGLGLGERVCDKREREVAIRMQAFLCHLGDFTKAGCEDTAMREIANGFVEGIERYDPQQLQRRKK